MFCLSSYKCLLKCSLIIIILECTAQTEAVENWDEEDHFNSGRKLLLGTSSMNGGEFAIYIIVVTIFTMISICCRLYCRQACKDECQDDTECYSCCGCEDESLTNPSQSRSTTTNIYQPPVLHQPRQTPTFTNFGDLSNQPREPGTLSFYNRTSFGTPLNTATIFAQDNSSTQPPHGITSAPPFYNFPNSPSVPQVHNLPGESHIYNIPSIPAPVNSVNAEDAPPDYASVILGDLLRGNEHTQYPSVIEKK